MSTTNTVQDFLRKGGHPGASLRAPVWVRRRLWGASDLEGVALRCDTLGKGLVDGKEGKIPVGAWLFDEDGLNVVMATDTQGRPALVYAAGSNGGVHLYVHGGNVRGKVWVPSVEPRRYTEPESPGYVDRNRLVGMLHVWGESQFRIDTPLFCDVDFVACGAFTENVARLLKRGPSSADEWPDYLAGIGKIEAGPGKPGDLLLFSDAERQGVLLDAETMIVLPGPYKNVGLRKVAGVKGHWRPRD